MTAGRLRSGGRVAVITGAARSLGRAYVGLLADLGAKVVINELGTSATGDVRKPRPPSRRPPSCARLVPKPSPMAQMSVTRSKRTHSSTRPWQRSVASTSWSRTRGRGVGTIVDTATIKYRIYLRHRRDQLAWHARGEFAVP
jgi:hypothetical protein